MPASSAYAQLTERFVRMHRLDHLQQIVAWDQSANMPPNGAEARGAALGEMAALLHRQRTDPAIATLLDAAEQESLDEIARANVREIRRVFTAATALPDELVQTMSVTSSRCEHAWRAQRQANDWAGFVPNLREVVRLARQAATLLAERASLGKYDALVESFEPGMRSATLDRVFGELRGWLPSLIQRIQVRQRELPFEEPRGPFPTAAQRALGERVMGTLGFDFAGGRLDTSTHPFSGGVPEDVRITTRYDEEDFVSSLMGVIHETGHARYEQNRPRALLGQPISEARSMGIHESQSLSFEMQLGRSRPFLELIAPLVVETFGDQPAFRAENLFRVMTRVEPSFIRVDADEVTYPAHVILRYEIERALIEGQLEVEDIPTAWDERMSSLLGVDTRGNYKDGPMQDVHWPGGAFGYFPSYTLGAMYAAQWFATIRRAHPDLDDRIRRGDLSPIFDWLKTHIWSVASQHATDELCRRATGSALDPAHFRAHLEKRYLG